MDETDWNFSLSDIMFGKYVKHCDLENHFPRRHFCHLHDLARKGKKCLTVLLRLTSILTQYGK